MSNSNVEESIKAEAQEIINNTRPSTILAAAEALQAEIAFRKKEGKKPQDNEFANLSDKELQRKEKVYKIAVKEAKKQIEQLKKANRLQAEREVKDAKAKLASLKDTTTCCIIV